jgi:hypothetical protein
VEFTYLSGASALEIDSVVLNCNGTEAMRDAHRSWSGKEDRENVYHVKVTPTVARASYALTAHIKGGGGTDLSGVLLFHMEK